MPSLKYITLTDPSQPARPRHMAYYDWGDPDNPDVVLCLHGLSRNGRDFDTLAQALCARYRVICPDVAGRGKSDWLTNAADYTYALYVHDAAQLLALLNLRNVAWIGTSMGGIIGMMLASAPDSRISRLVLNDIGAKVSAQGLKRILNYVGVSQTLFSNATEALAYLKSIMKSFGIQSEAQWELMMNASFTVLPDGRYTLAYDPHITKSLRDAAKDSPVEDIDLSAFWNRTRCPVLLLRGADSDILTRATAEDMCQRPFPTAFVEFPQTGHAPALLEDTQVQVITDWLSGNEVSCTPSSGPVTGVI